MTFPNQATAWFGKATVTPAELLWQLHSKYAERADRTKQALSPDEARSKNF